jgi:hypothetical protein
MTICTKGQTIFILSLLTGLTHGLAQAQSIPRMPNGKPNLNGVWQHPYVPDMSKDGKDQKGAGELPFTPWGANDFKTYDPAKYDYTGHCLPFGLMRSINVGGYPIQIMQNDQYVGLLFEQNTWFHVIYADGRERPKDLEPTWFGTSFGKWDGDTFVVDTIGFNGKTRLDTIGHPHTDALHLTERYQLTDPQHIAYEMTIDDPKAYTKPWKNTRVFTRMKPGEELIEYSCEENNRDFTEGHIK